MFDRNLNAVMMTAVKFLSVSLETGCEFIRIPSLVHHGIEGKPLHLSVETHFLLDEAEIQGTWAHTSSRSVSLTLVAFNNDSTITDMTYRQRLVFKAPDVSLTIKRLKAEDEGEYHLNLNMKFKTGLVVKEGITVHVTVDGECPSPPRQPVLLYWTFTIAPPLFPTVPVSIPVVVRSPPHAVVEDQANVTWSCAVERGTRVTFGWLRDRVALGPSDRYRFSEDNSTLFISPVKKEDRGSYSCVASNPVSFGRSSGAADLAVYCE